ncbi:MAG TPA: hypothetical protein VIJ47_14185 [Acidimicrobiales bacterium]
MEHAVFEMSRRRQLGSVVALMVLGASAIWGMGIASSASATDHKVTLCHATDSYTNPYVSVTVDYHSVVNGGHGNHDGPVFDPSVQGRKWGDIIPAFDLGPGAQYAGMNLDAVGQTILTSDCSVVPSTTTVTTGGV